MSTAKLLTAEEEEKLSKIINEDSDIWTVKGYDGGILCEDASTPLLVYSSRAAKVKREIEKVVEMQAEIELSKRTKALRIALSKYDLSVLKEAQELQDKYNTLIRAKQGLLDMICQLKTSVSDLRKKRRTLKYQEKTLFEKISILETKVLAMEQKVDETETIKSLEV